MEGGVKKEKKSSGRKNSNSNSSNLSKIEIGEEYPNSSSSSFGQKCSNLVKKQRTKFYILRRCVALLLCSHDRPDRP
ncbi:uncharacterized protein LOC105435882 [Cucumis sativus]|uniref:uncharacterized protein LOC105435882 n=1 Tax=Cucumis sativus TaxID=3659 RepID=UPI0005EC7765|nr:uncharacterized protein LOC105435882 [Cucumis sativus]KAE8647404.1 hypothetical protein Csa_004339 [Cucumis sativus]